MIETAYAVVTSTVAVVSEPATWTQVLAFMDKLIAIMTSPVMGKIVAVLIGILGGGKWLKNRAIQRYAELAFHTVEEMARTHPGNEKLDKIAAFGNVFEEYMKKNGWWIVTQADIDHANLIAKAINVTYSEGKEFVKDEMK